MNELYHGTNIENAIEVLKGEKLIGSINNLNQAVPYVSFSSDIIFSGSFGPIVFGFKTVENATEIKYDDFEWMMNNVGLTEYVASTSIEEVLHEGGLYFMQDEKEFVVEGEFVFDPKEITVYIDSFEFDNLQKVKNTLEKAAGTNLKFVVRDGLHYEIESIKFEVPIPSAEYQENVKRAYLEILDNKVA